MKFNRRGVIKIFLMGCGAILSGKAFPGRKPDAMAEETTSESLIKLTKDLKDGYNPDALRVPCNADGGYLLPPGTDIKNVLKELHYIEFKGVTASFKPIKFKKIERI